MLFHLNIIRFRVVKYVARLFPLIHFHPATPYAIWMNLTVISGGGKNTEIFSDRESTAQQNLLTFETHLDCFRFHSFVLLSHSSSLCNIICNRMTMNDLHPMYTAHCPFLPINAKWFTIILITRNIFH